jgi:Ca2+-transporting ATPase
MKHRPIQATLFVTVQHELYKLIRWLIATTVGLTIIAAIVAQFSGQMVAVFGWGVAVAMVPFSLIAGSIILQKQAADRLLKTRALVKKSAKASSVKSLVAAVDRGNLLLHNIKKALRCALATNSAELCTVLLGLAGLMIYRVAPAITVWQLIMIDVIAVMPPLTALGWDSVQAKLPAEKPHHLVSFNAAASFGLLAALLAYGNFALFFARHHLSARYLTDFTLPQYHQATMLTCLTLILCLYAHLFFERADRHEQVFTDYLWSNSKLNWALAGSGFVILNVIYNPLIQPLFHTGSLSFVDWLTALASAGIFTACRLLQRHTRQHTRRAVVKLHREVVR